MRVTKALRKLSDNIDSLIMKVVFVTIVGMIVSISLQIIFRVFFDALTWTEELSRYLLVWSTFLGATLAYKRSMHISVTFCVDLFKNTAKKIVIVFSIVLSLLFFVVVACFGIKYMLMQSTQVSAALRIPMRWVYIVIPISFIVMAVHGITGILDEIFKVKEVK
jgi:TRAP-type C4-dicarboxylate transport system permease small subunit